VRNSFLWGKFVSKVKYIAASRAQRAWWDDIYQLDRGQIGFDRVQVLESCTDPQPTGLLDANGNALFRLVEKEPIGFRLVKDE
jgi:hypothetical protein